MASQEPEAFPERVKRLVAERKAAGEKLSVAKVGYLAYDPNVQGTNPETYKTAVYRNGPVTMVLVEAVARVLGVPPEEFPEYRLAVARRTLDEHEVGLQEALAMLEAIEQALMHPQGAEALERLEAENNAANAQQRRASRRAPRNRPAS